MAMCSPSHIPQLALHVCALLPADPARHAPQALRLSHPGKAIRDTARFPPLMRAAAPGRRPKPRALRHLAAEQLGLAIQAGEHSPVDDARAALYLYQKHRRVRHHVALGDRNARTSFAGCDCALARGAQHSRRPTLIWARSLHGRLCVSATGLGAEAENLQRQRWHGLAGQRQPTALRHAANLTEWVC